MSQKSRKKAMTKKCIVSNKSLTNGKEFVIVDYALDYVKKMGYVVVQNPKIVYLMGLLVILSFLNLGLTTALLNNPSIPSIDSEDDFLTDVLGDNCILANKVSSTVQLTFNVSCAGVGGEDVNSVSSGDDYLIFNPTTGNVVGTINEAVLNGTIQDIVNQINLNPFDQSLNTTDSVNFFSVMADFFIGDGSNLSNVNFTETDPLWTGNSTLVLYTSDESNLNVNSSNFWDNLDSTNSTQFDNTGNILSISISWFTSLFDSLFGQKTVDDLADSKTVEDEKYFVGKGVAARVLSPTAFTIPLGSVHGLRATAPLMEIGRTTTGSTSTKDNAWIRRTQEPEVLFRVGTQFINDVTYAFGLIAGTGAVDINNDFGIFLKYDSSIDANWTYIVRNAGGTTSVDTNFPPSDTATFNDFEFIFNTTNAQLYINDVLISDVTTNIPAAALGSSAAVISAVDGTRTILFDRVRIRANV